MEKNINKKVIGSILDKREEGTIINNKTRRSIQGLLIRRKSAYQQITYTIRNLPKKYRYKIIDEIQEYVECINGEHSEYEKIYYETGFVDAIKFIHISTNSLFVLNV